MLSSDCSREIFLKNKKQKQKNVSESIYWSFINFGRKCQPQSGLIAKLKRSCTSDCSDVTFTVDWALNVKIQPICLASGVLTVTMVIDNSYYTRCTCLRSRENQRLEQKVVFWIKNVTYLASFPSPRHTNARAHIHTHARTHTHLFTHSLIHTRTRVNNTHYNKDNIY